MPGSTERVEKAFAYEAIRQMLAFLKGVRGVQRVWHVRQA